MRRILRGTLSSLSYRAIRLTNGAPAGLRMLTYHRVNDWHPDDLLSVPTARFKEQMNYLTSNGWHVITLVEAVRWIAPSSFLPPPSTLPPKAVVLTFDDGYADNYWHAYPVLRGYGFPATLFVASGLMDRHEPMPRYAKHGVVQQDRGLSWNEIRTMQAGSIEIGAHSVTHPDLTALPLAEATREIVESKRELELETGRPVSAFAYPKGRLNARIARAVRDAGFSSACSERIGANRPGEDLFRLRRTEISAFDTLEDFEKKLAGAYDWIHATMRTVRR